MCTTVESGRFYVCQGPVELSSCTLGVDTVTYENFQESLSDTCTNIL